MLSTYSGGEIRVVSVLSALMARMPVVVLDEPTAELDPIMRQRVWDVLFFEFRHEWVWYLAFGTFSSVMFLVFLWLVLGRGSPESALYIITGNLTQTLTSFGMLSLGQEIGSMKNSSIFDHYAALPISKVSFIPSLRLCSCPKKHCRDSCS